MTNTLDRLSLWRRVALKLFGGGQQEALVDEFDDPTSEQRHTHAIDTLANAATINSLDFSLRAAAVADTISPEIQPVAVASTNPLRTPRVDGTVWHSGVETLDDLFRKPGPSSARPRVSSSGLFRHRSQSSPRSDPTERYGHHTIARAYHDHGLSALLPLLIVKDLLGRRYGPLILPHPIYEFQRDGVEFLLAKTPGALLADDMGLGKTVQSIIALRVLFHKGEVQNALVVAPKPVLVSWERHFNEWAPEIRVKSLMGPPKVRQTLWRDLAEGDFQVGIITYESLRSDYDRLTNQKVLKSESLSHKPRHGRPAQRLDQTPAHSNEPESQYQDLVYQLLEVSYSAARPTELRKQYQALATQLYWLNPKHTIPNELKRQYKDLATQLYWLNPKRSNPTELKRQYKALVDKLYKLSQEHTSPTETRTQHRGGANGRRRLSRSGTVELSGLPQLGVLIADEVQKIKNPPTKVTKAMRSLVAQRRWALSGTPLENRIADFAAVLRFVDRSVQDVHRSNQDSSAIEQQLKPQAEHLMLRRRKIQVLDQLPKLFTHIEYIELGSKQRRAYDLLERQEASELRSKARNITNITPSIHKLKQVCNGVGLSDAKIENPKLEWLEDYLRTAEAERDKTLVFSHYTNMLPSEMKRLFQLKYQGHMPSYQQERVIDEFKRSSDQYAMLMSVRAASLGLNLQVANRVVHFDSWWNPAVQQQATARVHRIGQKKTVFETTLVTVGTIEESIQARLDHKRELFGRVVDDLSVDGVSKLLSLDEMYGLFGLS